MSDYSKSVIYKFHKVDLPEIYIGSTNDEIKREQDHNSVCNNENRKGYNLKVYEFIRANGGYDNWKFEVIEEYPCENRTELRIREQYYYDLLNPELNTNRPYVSEEERKEDNIKRYEERKDYQSKYKAKHYQDNKKYNAKYYIDNIEEILKKLNHKCICECGKEYTHGHKTRHCDSKRHKEFIEKQNK